MTTPEWSWDDYRQTALEDGDIEAAVKKISPPKPPKTLSARPKARKPQRRSVG